MSRQKEQIDQYFIETALAFGDYVNYKGCPLIKRSDTEYILYIPDSKKRAPSEVFSEDEYECAGVNLMVIGGKNLDTTKSMFEDCKAEYIDLRFFNTSNVRNMTCMFNGCRARYIDLSSFDTSNVKYMDSMFQNCGPEVLNLSSFNTSKVINMDYMFYVYSAELILGLNSLDL